MCAALSALVAGEERAAQADILNPGGRSNLTASALFRQNRDGWTGNPGSDVATAYFAPLASFESDNTTNYNNYYYLIDVDIDASSGQPLYSALYKYGVPYSFYVEGNEATLGNDIAAYAGAYSVVSMRTYLNPAGQPVYGAVFQETAASQQFHPGLSVSQLATFEYNLEQTGYFLSDLSVYVSGGQEYYNGIWTYHPQGSLRSKVLWGSATNGIGWNTIAADTLTYAAQGYRLATLAHWEFNGQRRYAAVWLDGTDPYDVVAGTDWTVMERKRYELAPVGKTPVRIYAEHGYQPPLGLAASFNDHLDVNMVGYSYAVSEEGITTGYGGFGYARAPWETQNPGVPMTETSRLDVASVSKSLAAAALLHLLEQGTYKDLNGHVLTLDTLIVNIFPTSVLGVGGKWGAGIGQVTLRNLLDMDAGLCDKGANGCTADCDGNNQTSVGPYLTCLFTNCTVNANGVCGTPPFNSSPPNQAIYNGANSSVIVAVIEQETTGAVSSDASGFETYLHNNISVPAGMDTSAPATDLSNVNCVADFSTSATLLYPAGQQIAGDLDESYARSQKVCGAGALQMNVVQMHKFMMSLMAGNPVSTKGITGSDLNYLLNDQPMMGTLNWQSAWGTNSLGDRSFVFAGNAYSKNGGYGDGNGHGLETIISMDPTMSPSPYYANEGTNVAIIANTAEPQNNPGGWIDPESAVADGLDRMYSYPRGTVSIVNQNTVPNGPMCFNVSGASGSLLNNGTNLIQWTCGTAPLAGNEQFVLRDMPSGRFMIEATVSGKCLSLADGGAGTAVVQNECNGQPNQQFFFLPTGNTPGFGVLEPQNSSGTQMCLQFSGNANGSGPNIVQEPCDTTGKTWQQQFMLHSVDVVAVTNRYQTPYGSMCLNVSGNSSGQNAPIIQWTCGAAPVSSNMEFRFVNLNNGYFNLQGTVSGRCVTVQGNSSAQNQPMLQYDCNHGLNQNISFRPTTGGWGNLVMENSNLCLSITNTTGSGGAIEQKTCPASGTSSPMQEFMLLQQ
jgi:CubicO group peptidase (beta-lactamase class C family)